MTTTYIGRQPVPDGVAIFGDTNPVGTIAWFHTVAAGWLQLNGQTVSKTTYPDLWAYAQNFLTLNQTTDPGLFLDAGGDDFNLPNLAALFLRGLGGASAGLGVLQADTVGPHTHDSPAQTPGSGGAAGPISVGSAAANASVVTSAQTPSGTTETRPANVALLPCIKALPVLFLTPETQSSLLWQGSSRTISAAAPDNGVGVDGDFWFQYE